jgi:hypothetical protein
MLLASESEGAQGASKRGLRPVGIVQDADASPLCDTGSWSASGDGAGLTHGSYAVRQRRWSGSH